jgi:pimeloyl-ACP methyl ester carboxylesterase
MIQPPLRPLPVSPEFLPWRGHRIARYSAGAGQPLLLVHSINAAASAFEMRGPFGGLRDSYAVHALDLLGYGNSDRPARRYRADDYVDQLLTALAVLGAPAVLVASSLSAAYAIEAAARRPELVRGLVLACPTGIKRLATQAGPGARAAYRVLRGPVGRTIFAGLTSRRGMRLFLKSQAYYDPRAISEDVLAGFYETCRRPGAYYAPICFLTGLLNCAVRAAFARLTMPTLIIWGRQATTTPVDDAQDFLAANPRARLEVIDQASLLVQDERPAAFNALVRSFIEHL